MSEPKNLETRTGMVLSDLIEKAGGFCKEPKKVIIPNDCDDFANDIWNSLDKENRIALYVSYTDVKTGRCEHEKIIQG